MTMDVILCGKVVLWFCFFCGEIRQLCWTATSGTPTQLRSARGKPSQVGEERKEEEKNGGRGGSRIRQTKKEERGRRNERKEKSGEAE